MVSVVSAFSLSLVLCAFPILLGHGTSRIGSRHLKPMLNFVSSSSVSAIQVQLLQGIFSFTSQTFQPKVSLEKILFYIYLWVILGLKCNPPMVVARDLEQCPALVQYRKRRISILPLPVSCHFHLNCLAAAISVLQWVINDAFITVLFVVSYSSF